MTAPALEWSNITQEQLEVKFEAEFQAFSESALSVVAASNPDKASRHEQMNAFLADEIVNPRFEYPRLQTLTEEEINERKERGDDLLAKVSLLEEPHRTVYEAFIAEKLLQTNLIRAMKSYNEAVSDEERGAAREEFMRLNVAMYGEPDENTYLSLLSEKVAGFAQKDLSPEAKEVFTDLLTLLPIETTEQAAIPQGRFRPSRKTISWMRTVVENLYSNMLNHVPETDELIGPIQLRDIFETIIRMEFEEAADGWQVKLAEVKAVSVSARSKTVLIPVNRQPMDVAEVRRLVVHEIGIHVLTAITGESTNIRPLADGIAGYSNTQEGLAKVTEQALEGEFKEAGVDHYITSGLAYFHDKDFRGAIEIKWRMKLLEDLDSGAAPTFEQIERARRLAADGPLIATSRVFRGTNDLPLFKDLNYYNGSAEVWKYLEQICGDDLQLSFLLAGKISSAKKDQRVVLESKSI